MIQLTAAEQIEYAKSNGITPNFRIDIGVGQKVWHAQDDWDAYTSKTNVTVTNGYVELTNTALEGRITLAEFHCQDIGSYTEFAIDGIPEESAGGAHLEIETSNDGVTWGAVQTPNHSTTLISSLTAKAYTRFTLVLDADSNGPIITKLILDYHFNIDLEDSVVAVGDLSQSASDVTLSEFLNSNMQISLSMNRNLISAVQSIINNKDYLLYVNVFAGFGTDEHLIFKGVIKDMSVKDGIKNTIITIQVVDFTDILRTVICDDIIQEVFVESIAGILDKTDPELASITPSVSPAWGVNALAGKTIAIIGDEYDLKFDIISNTADSIVFDSSEYSELVNGAEYDFEVRYWPTALSVMDLIKNLLYSQDIFDLSLVQAIDVGVGNIRICDNDNGVWQVVQLMKINEEITCRLEKNSSNNWRLSSIKSGTYYDSGEPIIYESSNVSEMNGYDGTLMSFGCMMFDPEQYARESGINHVAFYCHYKISGTHYTSIFVFDIGSGLLIRKSMFYAVVSVGEYITTAGFQALDFPTWKLAVTDISETTITFDVACVDNNTSYKAMWVAINQSDSTYIITFTKVDVRQITYEGFIYSSNPSNYYSIIAVNTNYSPGIKQRFISFYIGYGHYIDLQHVRACLFMMWYDPIVGVFLREMKVTIEAVQEIDLSNTWINSCINSGIGVLIAIHTGILGGGDVYPVCKLDEDYVSCSIVLYDAFHCPANPDARSDYFYVIANRTDVRTILKITPSTMEEATALTTSYDITLPTTLFYIGHKTGVVSSSIVTPTIFTSDGTDVYQYGSHGYSIPETSTFEGKTIWEVLSIIANGFLFFIGVSCGRFFFRKNIGGSFLNITENEIISIGDAKVDVSNIYNEVVIEHSSGLKKYSSPSSIAKWGRKSKTIIVPFISEENADDLAEEFFEQYSKAVYKISVKIRYSPQVEIIDSGMFVFPDVAFGVFSNILELKHSLSSMSTTLKIRMRENIESSYYGISEYGIANYGE